MLLLVEVIDEGNAAEPVATALTPLTVEKDAGERAPSTVAKDAGDRGLFLPLRRRFCPD